jgi:hypothetical protein
MHGSNSVISRSSAVREAFKAEAGVLACWRLPSGVMLTAAAHSLLVAAAVNDAWSNQMAAGCDMLAADLLWCWRLLRCNTDMLMAAVLLMWLLWCRHAVMIDGWCDQWRDVGGCCWVLTGTIGFWWLL